MILKQKIYVFKVVAGIALFLITAFPVHAEENSVTPSETSAVETMIEDQQPAEAEAGETVEAEKAVMNEEPSVEAQPEAEAEPEPEPVKDFVGLSWEASSKGEVEKLNALVSECVATYEAEAREQQAGLKALPNLSEAKQYTALNDLGTCLFIKAEAAMNHGKTEQAIKEFEYIIEQFPFSQAWDPRGWFWSVAEKSQASIDVLTGKAQQELDEQVIEVHRTKPVLVTPIKSAIIDYTKYGEFLDVGKSTYRYNIKDMAGLRKAIGEGIYPNNGGVYKNPRYKIVKEEGRLEGSHWDFTNSDDLEAAFFKWATAKEPMGVRLFYIGTIFEKAGMYKEAIRAYHALVVNFPKQVAWTYWQTPWYPAQAAIAKIKHIIRLHPELNLKVKWMNIKIDNGYDNDTDNDVIYTYPGKIYEVSFLDRMKESIQGEQKVPLETIKKKVGSGQVRLVQYDNGHWQLLVNDKPYVIQAVTYTATKVGQSPDKGTLANWMEEDTNENGRPDGPYDSWVDKNRNNEQDDDEPVVGDFQLMKEMGVNTIRIYHHPDTPNKEVLRDLYNTYGIRVIMGDFLGKYALGSGASWKEGTDYENPEHRKNMLESVKQMVNEHKDEPYVLLWLLGNENNYGVACNADKKPAAFFKFADEVAQWIKSVDPNHPVAINNGDTLYLDVFAENAPNIDIFTANVYRGDYGFGSFWEQVADAADRPAFITEYGSPAYARHLTLEEGEKAQADYHKGNWLDIQTNLAGTLDGTGNALGGVIFEWMDEWWKNYEPYLHDRKSDAIGPFPGGYYFEEWFGIIGQGNGQKSPFLRQLRDTYFLYQDFWTDNEK
ncbi:MAG: tetratricopeptide repeat protein [Candidatus Omnitrophica bacterium]|nr:tetratricopeptide repeat protein [Candidatus Omnitrophota bacterium]